MDQFILYQAKRSVYLCLLGSFVLMVVGCAARRGVDHEIKKGQTLWRISRVYRVKLDTLLEVNDIEDPTEILPGTKITIPGAERRRTVPRSPGMRITRSESQSNDHSSDNQEKAPDRIKPGSNKLPSKQENKEQRAQAKKSNRPLDQAANYFDPVWPCKGRIISSFKKIKGPTKRGLLIQTNEGSVVKAAEDGNVKMAGSWKKMPELGKIVIIFHSNNFTTVYAHLGEIRVSEGELINKGQVLGTVGRIGTVDRSACYFEVRYELEPRDPLIFLGKQT